MNRNAELAARRAAAVAGFELYLNRPDIGIEVYYDQIREDWISAQCFIGKAGKPAWYYRFRSIADLDAYIDRQIRGRQASLEYKAKAKAARSAAVEVAVGDVFECSWGYDQTNIDYYQVTRLVGAKSVEVRKIGAVSWDTSYLQGRSVPAPDSFIGPPMVKRLRAAGADGAAIRITSFADAYRMKPVIEGVPAYPSSAWTAYA